MYNRWLRTTSCDLGLVTLTLDNLEELIFWFTNGHKIFSGEPYIILCKRKLSIALNLQTTNFNSRKRKSYTV